MKTQSIQTLIQLLYTGKWNFSYQEVEQIIKPLIQELQEEQTNSNGTENGTGNGTKEVKNANDDSPKK